MLSPPEWQAKNACSAFFGVEELPLGLEIIWDTVDTGGKRYYHVYWDHEFLWSYQIDLSSPFADVDEQEILAALAKKRTQVGLTEFREALEGGIDAAFELIPGAELYSAATGQTLTGRETSRIQAAGWAAVGIFLGAKLKLAPGCADEGAEAAWRSRRQGGRISDVVEYGTRHPGLRKHHGVLDVWASRNVRGYVTRGPTTPAILLTVPQHDATNKVLREWSLAKFGQKVGAKIDWAKVSAREAQDLARRMLQAAGVPEEAQRLYFRAFHQHIHGLR